MNKETKDKIKSIVKMYIEVFSDEFELFKMSLRDKKNNLRDKQFATVKDMDSIQRALYEIPETLHNLLFNRLEEEELNELRTKEGGLWFAKTFKDFRISEKV